MSAKTPTPGKKRQRLISVVGGELIDHAPRRSRSSATPLEPRCLHIQARSLVAHAHVCVTTLFRANEQGQYSDCCWLKHRVVLHSLLSPNISYDLPRLCDRLIRRHIIAHAKCKEELRVVWAGQRSLGGREKGGDVNEKQEVTRSDRTRPETWSHLN